MLLSIAGEGEIELSISEVDITSEPEIYELYKYRIPVLLIDGKIRLEGRIDERKILRALFEGFGPKI